ncbi:MAG TPA: VOC family protein [Solirubrobacteraceae bacterium]|jgi:catechol 2,3-dioxygenase-like lactoylglutathione lyase family enzyme|nr:VOC family protein [Solirubrobacteraceae bacterium]
MSTTAPIVTGVDFIMLPTQDYAAAVEFYGTTLGLPHTADYGRMPGGEFQAGNLTLQLFEVAALGREFSALPFPLALQVDDVHAAQAELESRGVTFAPDLIDSGVCHMAFFKDPDGNALMLHHRYKPRDAG